MFENITIINNNLLFQPQLDSYFSVICKADAFKLKKI